MAGQPCFRPSACNLYPSAQQARWSHASGVPWSPGATALIGAALAAVAGWLVAAGGRVLAWGFLAALDRTLAVPFSTAGSAGGRELDDGR